jgi:formylmethanofuran dehydrogenase subunit A
MFHGATNASKDGDLVERNGEVTQYKCGKTLNICSRYDNNIISRLDAYYYELYGLPRSIFHPPVGTAFS